MRLLCYLLLLDRSLEIWQNDIENTDQKIVEELRKCQIELDSLESPRDNDRIALVQSNILKSTTSNTLRNFVSKTSGLEWAVFEKMMADAEHLLYDDDRDYLLISIKKLLSSLRKTLIFTDVS